MTIPRALLQVGGLTLALLCSTTLTAAEQAPAKAPVILLKLDDLINTGTGANATVSAHWKRVTDFLESNHLKANYGIVCESLAADAPGYIAWLKEHHDKGLIEFWNHGYYFSYKPEAGSTAKGQFEGTTVAQQREYLEHGQRLAKEKLGFELSSFGPHVCHTDAATYEALEAIPAITMIWFYAPPAGVATSKFVFQRTINLENPIFCPNPDDVKQRFEKQGHTQEYIAMQGHPDTWNDEKFAAFTKTVTYLRDQGCAFMTASEFLASHKPANAGQAAPKH